MGSETLSQAAVVEFAASTFVPVKLDFLSAQAAAREYGVLGVPTTVVLGADGERLARLEGFYRPDRFIARLREIVADDAAYRAGLAVLQTAPDDARANFDVGRVHRLRERHGEAIPLLEKVLTSDPEDRLGFAATTHWHLSLAWLGRGDLDRARVHNDRVSALDPEDKQGYLDDTRFLACELALRVKDWSGAEPLLAAFVRDFPGSEFVPHALVYLGMTCLKLGDRLRALAMFEQCVRDHPDSYWSVHASRRLIPPLKGGK